MSNFGSEEEDKTEDSEDEEKEDSENNSQKSSDDSSENQTDDSSKTDNQLQKEDEKNDDSNNEVKPEDDSDHTDKPSSDDEPSSLKNNDDSTDVNTIADDQDENPQPLTPLEAAGAEAVTDNIPKRSSPVRQGFGKAYIEATIHDKTIRGAKLTIDDKTYWSSVEIEAFAPDLQKVEVTAEYLDEHHVSYRGRKSFTIDWVGRQKIQVEMVREDGVAKIVAMADGVPL